MTIAVVGANGRSGREFVRLAIERGHTIRAGFHHKNNLTKHPHLASFKCDTSNLSQVKELLMGSDAVVSFIGHGRKSPANVQSEAITNLITVCEDLNINRLISLTGTGVRFPGDHITFLDRLLNLSISLIDPARVKDGKNHVRIIQESKLNWTIIRVLKLTNSKTGSFSLSPNGPPKLFTGRAEVATATLNILEKNQFIGQAPIISK